MEELSYTTDLGFAAALLTLGHRIYDELEDGQDGRKKFGFYITEEVMSRVFNSYSTYNLTVDAQRNAESIKHVKKMLYKRTDSI